MFENEPRSLTLPEFREIRKIDDPNASDVYLLSRAFGVTEDEAESWFHAAPIKAAGEALQRAWAASGLVEEAQFQAEAASDAEPAREGIDL